MTMERTERALAKDPTNGTALAAGAYSLAMFGDKERAVEWMRRALVLDPDNLNMRYNLACTMVRQLGDVDETLNTLEPFFERVSSATIMRHMEVDPDLNPLRSDPRFQKMFAATKQRLGIPVGPEA
jgi:adenylate cyclase